MRLQGVVFQGFVIEVSEEELMLITAADFQTILDDAMNAADDAIFA